MAAGGSAPEFFTSIIGATIAPWHSLERSIVQLSVKLCYMEPGSTCLKCCSSRRRGAKWHWFWHDCWVCSLQCALRHWIAPTFAHQGRVKPATAAVFSFQKPASAICFFSIGRCFLRYLWEITGIGHTGLSVYLISNVLKPEAMPTEVRLCSKRKHRLDLVAALQRLSEWKEVDVHATINTYVQNIWYMIYVPVIYIP